MTPPVTRSRTFWAVVLIGLTVLATTAPPVTAQSAPEPAFVVEVHSGGSAAVSVRSTFDLTTDAEREAFQSLRTDEQAQQAATARFLGRMRTVASDTENATGRSMAVRDATIDLRRTADNETGVVTLSVTWTGLAAMRGTDLVVSEPFASGFTTDRPFVLRAPDGYVVGAVTPPPDERREAAVSWNAGSDLTGFEVELVPAPTPTATTAPTTTDTATRSGGQPGFGLVAAGLGLLVAVVGALARRPFDS